MAVSCGRHFRTLGKKPYQWERQTRSRIAVHVPYTCCRSVCTRSTTSYQLLGDWFSVHVLVGSTCGALQSPLPEAPTPQSLPECLPQCPYLVFCLDGGNLQHLIDSFDNEFKLPPSDIGDNGWCRPLSKVRGLHQAHVSHRPTYSCRSRCLVHDAFRQQPDQAGGYAAESLAEANADGLGSLCAAQESVHQLGQ